MWPPSMFVYTRQRPNRELKTANSNRLIRGGHPFHSAKLPKEYHRQLNCEI